MKILDFYFKRGHILLNEYHKLMKTGMSKEEAKNCLYAFCEEKTAYLYAVNVVNLPKSNVFLYNKNENKTYLQWVDEITNTYDMKFDYIIQNPPYNGSLHLDFLEKGLDLLTEKGRMVIIEPATWLINLNPKSEYNTGKRGNSTCEIKNRIDGHVESVVIENLNDNFGTSLHVPFSIVTIDMAKSFEKIKFICCGEEKYVDSINDCNLVGKREVINSIFSKIMAYGDFMSNHIYEMGKTAVNDDTLYARYAQICDGEIIRKGRKPKPFPSKNGDFCESYFSVAFFCKNNEPSKSPVKRILPGSKKVTDDIGNCIFGTDTELRNWKYYIFNNKLPLFISICLMIDQNNMAKTFIPWVVDKTYSDDELYKLFNFTDQEIELINSTISKFEFSNQWFKRYMTGPNNC